MMHHPSESKVNPKLSTPEMRDLAKEKEKSMHCRSKRSMSSMKSSLTLSLRNLPSMMHVNTSLPCLMKTPHSQPSNEPKLTGCTANNLKRHTVLECELSPGVSMHQTLPGEPMLLERMGLGNQILMMRLRLPLKFPRGPSQEMPLASDPDVKVQELCSNKPVMMKGMTAETTPGTGRNPGVDHHGRMSRIQCSQLQRRPTSCRMSMSSISNKRSRVWSPSGTGQISPLSFGKTCWQTDKLTLQPWLKIVSRESLPTMKSATLVITASSQQKWPVHLNLRSLPT